MTQQNAVLLVEDDRVLLDLNKRVLTNEGYRVISARNLQEARTVMEKDIPQAVVLDVDLPDGSGLDFCRELRRTTTIPIVFLTARKGGEDEQAGYDAGADGYITKPYRIEELTKSIGKLTAQNCSKY